MAGVSCSARVALSFVARDVLATDNRSSRSTSFSSLKESRNLAIRISGRPPDSNEFSYFQSFHLGDLIPVGNNSGMQTFRDVSVGLL